MVMYTDKDPSHEDPNLVWRRDAIISIAEDKEVSCVPCLEDKEVSCVPCLEDKEVSCVPCLEDK